MTEELSIKQIMSHLLTSDYKGMQFKRQCLLELMLRAEKDASIFMEVGNLTLEEAHDLRKWYADRVQQVPERRD